MRIIESADVEADIEQVLDEAMEAGRVTLLVEPFPTKEEVLREYARKLAFPDYFGRSLDAFADAMGDFVEALVGPTTVAVAVDPEFEEESGAAQIIEEILEETESQAPEYMPLEFVVVKQQ